MALARTIITGLVLTPLFGAAASGSDWMHNGSVMTLLDAGNERAFVYKEPHARLKNVTPGTVLFKGERRKMTYIGRATSFSAKCGEVQYVVEGNISEDERRITMSGEYPVRDDTCKITSYRPDTLEFTFIEPKAPVATDIPVVTEPKTAEKSRFDQSFDAFKSGASEKTAPSAPVQSPLPQDKKETNSLSVFDLSDLIEKAVKDTTITLPKPAPATTHVDLPTIVSNKKYTGKAQDIYDQCAALWNKGTYMPRAGSKAIVAGWKKTSDGGSEWKCFTRYDANSSDHQIAEEIATKACKAEFTECFTFARGNTLTAWAEKQKAAILNGERARNEQQRIEGAKPLPASSNTSHRTQGQRQYDKCSSIWNKDKVGAQAGGKAMVAGYRTSDEETAWNCFWNSYEEGTDKKAEEEATRRCKQRFNSCRTFAYGNELMPWAEREKNSILDGSRAAMQRQKAEEAAAEEEEEDNSGSQLIEGVLRGIQRYNNSRPYTPVPETRQPAPCRKCAPGNRNMECCRP